MFGQLWCGVVPDRGVELFDGAGDSVEPEPAEDEPDGAGDGVAAYAMPAPPADSPAAIAPTTSHRRSECDFMWTSVLDRLPVPIGLPPRFAGRL